MNAGGDALSNASAFSHIKEEKCALTHSSYMQVQFALPFSHAALAQINALTNKQDEHDTQC